MSDNPIDIEIVYVGKTVNLVVPKQPGVNFQTAAPRLAAFARKLAIELGTDVTINGDPEMHIHPEQRDRTQVSFGSRGHAH